MKVSYRFIQLYSLVVNMTDYKFNIFTDSTLILSFIYLLVYNFVFSHKIIFFGILFSSSFINAWTKLLKIGIGSVVWAWAWIFIIIAMMGGSSNLRIWLLLQHLKHHSGCNLLASFLLFPSDCSPPTWQRLTNLTCRSPAKCKLNFVPPFVLNSLRYILKL